MRRQLGCLKALSEYQRFERKWPSLLDRSVRILILRRLKTALTLFLLTLRYLANVISFWKLFYDSVHDFSQLMILTTRIRRLQGMTSSAERACFYWIARQVYTGRGEIVDLGRRLGSTTIPLAMGLIDKLNSSGT